MRFLPAAALGGSILLLLFACSQDDESGACPGSMDGTYYRLQMFNADPDNSMEIRVNGRFIGNVPRATTQGTSLRPGDSILGVFPVCDQAIIESDGTNIGSGRVCSNASYLSPDCRQTKPDYCWESFLAYPAGTTPPYVEPSRFQSPQCSAAMKADGTFPCADACVAVDLGEPCP